MKRVGKPGEVIIPYGILEGPGGDIPLTSVQVSLGVGSIPTCRVGIPIEFLNSIPDAATKEKFTVKVGEAGGELFTIFKGYISGRSGRIDSKSLETGLTLVHPARDLDLMRIVSPGMHSQGESDWSYERTNARQTMFKAGGGPLPEQLIDGISESMTAWQTASNRYPNSPVEAKTVSYRAARLLLSDIEVLNGDITKVGGALEGSINDDARISLEGSWNTQSSLWNTLISMLANFGLTVICHPKGMTQITSELANFTPPDENYIYSDEILSFDLSSTFQRNVREVVLLNSGIRPSRGTDGVEENPVKTIAIWPPNAQADDAGGTLAMYMPVWLSPLIINENAGDDGPSGDEPPSASNPDKKPSGGAPKIDTSIEDAQLALAHKFYNLERNKWRTMSIVGPLAPGAVPGTTVWVQPYSSVVALSGAEVGGGELYSGYIAEVSHSMSAQGGTLTTNLVLTHVSLVTDALNVTSDPIFTDAKAFTLD